MRSEVPTSKLFVPIWTAGQRSTFLQERSVSSHAAPIFLNQKAVDSATKSLPSYWPEFNYDSLNRIGDSALSVWRNFRSSPDAPWSTLVWRGAREAAYISRLLENACLGDEHAGSTIGLIPPHLSIEPSTDGIMELLPLAVLREFSRKHGIALKILNSPKPPGRPAHHEAGIPANKHVKTCVLTFGIPDLGRVVAEFSKRPGHTLFITTPDCYAHIEALDIQIKGLRSASLVHLKDPLPREHHELRSMLSLVPEVDRTASFSEMAPYALKDFCNTVHSFYGPIIRRLNDQIRDVIHTTEPDELVFANHDSPYTRTFQKIADQQGLKTHLMEHSLWPLRTTPFLLSGLDRLKGHHRFYTQSGMQNSNSADSNQLRPELKTWSTLQVNPLQNAWRKFLYKLRGESMGMKVGIVLTTGQAYCAMDIVQSEVLKNLALFCVHVFERDETSRIIIRVRDRQDNAEFVRSLVFRHLDEKYSDNVEFSIQSNETFREFVKSCNRLVECGFPSSASYEAMAHGVPVYRIADPGSDKLRFLSRPIRMIELDSLDPNPVHDLIRKHQSDLILEQRRFLKRELTL